MIICLLAVLGMYSCKKDYTCQCDISVVQSDGTPVFTNTEIITINHTKERAEIRCKAYERTDISAQGDVTTFTCAIAD